MASAAPYSPGGVWSGSSRPYTSQMNASAGIADLVTRDASAAPEIEQLRTWAYEGVIVLVERARSAGVLRVDFTDQDVVLLMANAGLVERAHGIADSASARLIGLLLDGLRAEVATSTPAPPSPSAVREAMRRNGRCRLGPDPGTQPE